MKEIETKKGAPLSDLSIKILLFLDSVGFSGCSIKAIHGEIREKKMNFMQPYLYSLMRGGYIDRKKRTEWGRWGEWKYFITKKGLDVILPIQSEIIRRKENGGNRTATKSTT